MSKLSDAPSAMEEGQAGIAPYSPASSRTATYLSSEAAEKTCDAESVESPSCADAKVPLLVRIVRALQKKFEVSRQDSCCQPKIRKLNYHPRGYPNLSAFLDSHENFMLYRRFGYVQSRLLLQKQDELRRLEEELEELDTEDATRDAGMLCTRDDDSQGRKELMEKVEEKFCSYAKILSAAQHLMSFSRPSLSDYTSVANYMFNRAPLCEGEDEWILHKEDMISLRASREHAWLDDVVERVLRAANCGIIQKMFCSPDSLAKTEDCLDSAGNVQEYERGCEIYYTPSRVKTFSNSILLVLILALLIAPISIMYRLISSKGMSEAYVSCIGVMFIATLAFSSMLALFTKAKRHELLGAAAAYCAVLVVFLGNVGDK